MTISRVARFGLAQALAVLLAAFAIAMISAIAQPAQQAHAADTQVMYRMYNPNSGEHFYTKDSNERDSLRRAGWNYEGPGWTAPVSSSTPVYRLYSGTDHHYTTSAGERDDLRRAGWSYEGIGWYSDDAQGVPLYRQFNPNVDPKAKRNNSGSHNYTTNKGENDNLVRLGWRAEGIGWYGVNTNAQANSAATQAPVTDERLKATHVATITIKDYGTITLDLYGKAAPKTVANFVKLADSGFYDNSKFHRIISNFMIQGGAKNGNIYDDSGEKIIGEFSKNGYDNPIKHTRGVISMARSGGRDGGYDTASSQFFIVHQTNADNTYSLDGYYAPFGCVTSGMEVVDKICANAKPYDDNGSVYSSEQPVITSIKVRAVQ